MSQNQNVCFRIPAAVSSSQNSTVPNADHNIPQEQNLEFMEVVEEEFENISQENLSSDPLNLSNQAVASNSFDNSCQQSTFEIDDHESSKETLHCDDLVDDSVLSSAIFASTGNSEIKKPSIQHKSDHKNSSSETIKKKQRFRFAEPDEEAVNSEMCKTYEPDSTTKSPEPTIEDSFDNQPRADANAPELLEIEDPAHIQPRVEFHSATSSPELKLPEIHDPACNQPRVESNSTATLFKVQNPVRKRKRIVFAEKEVPFRQEIIPFAVALAQCKREWLRKHPK